MLPSALPHLLRGDIRICGLVSGEPIDRKNATHVTRGGFGMKWFIHCLCLSLVVASGGLSYADEQPPHITTQITEVFTGWDADLFGIKTTEPVANPAGCKVPTGYASDSKQAGFHTFYAAALAALAQRATVIVVVDPAKDHCVANHPKLMGLNILRFP